MALQLQCSASCYILVYHNQSLRSIGIRFCKGTKLYVLSFRGSRNQWCMQKALIMRYSFFCCTWYILLLYHLAFICAGRKSDMHLYHPSKHLPRSAHVKGGGERAPGLSSQFMEGACMKELIHTVILPDWTLKKWGLSNFAFQHFKEFIAMHRHPMQKEFFRSTEGFLRAALTGHGHPVPHWKIAKMALFNPCM